MADKINALAPHHLPVFITAPGEPDLFFNGSAIFMIAMVLLLGGLYFRLHALPEKFAHGTPNPLQFEIVAVLSLLALFTHNHLYWVAALLLALIRIPDFTTPLSAMADSLARLAGRRSTTSQPIAEVGSNEEVSQPRPRAKDAEVDPRNSKAGQTPVGSDQTTA